MSRHGTGRRDKGDRPWGARSHYSGVAPPVVATSSAVSPRSERELAWNGSLLQLLIEHGRKAEVFLRGTRM